MSFPYPQRVSLSIRSGWAPRQRRAQKWSGVGQIRFVSDTLRFNEQLRWCNDSYLKRCRLVLFHDARELEICSQEMRHLVMLGTPDMKRIHHLAFVERFPLKRACGSL